MKKLVILALMALMIPATGMAMQGMDHKNDSNEMDHGSMGMEGVIMLQDKVVDGVKGSAHLMEMEGGMGQMLMVMFTDEKSGAMIMKGKVALKVESPDGKVGEARKMKISKGMFGVGVKFEQTGVYKYKVGTKLADGQKRTFHFHHKN
jgi:hypothetical protein